MDLYLNVFFIDLIFINSSIFISSFFLPWVNGFWFAIIALLTESVFSVLEIHAFFYTHNLKLFTHCHCYYRQGVLFALLFHSLHIFSCFGCQIQRSELRMNEWKYYLHYIVSLITMFFPWSRYFFTLPRFSSFKRKYYLSLTGLKACISWYREPMMGYVLTPLLYAFHFAGLEQIVSVLYYVDYISCSKFMS